MDSTHSLDVTDPLAPFRARFHLPADAPIYLDGNSLGLLSSDAEASVQRVLAEWKSLAICGWLDASPPWFTLAENLAERVGALIGAAPGEVAVANSTTVNLHQLLATLYDPAQSRRKILAFGGEFPSDLYAIKSHLRLRGVDPSTHLMAFAAGANGLIDEAALANALRNPEVQLAVLPAVVYTTGQLLNLRSLAAVAREGGVTIGFDLSHSIGVVPHTLAADGIDFAFWCHYKYLNAGPGAVGGLYLHARHFSRAPGLAGWWGADKPSVFDMSAEMKPAAGAARLQVGTPPILGLVALEGALAITEEAGLDRIRTKSLQLTNHLMQLIDTQLAHHGFEIVNPRADGARGGHVALRHSEAARLCRALKQSGVVTDFRPPDIVRLAPVPLYNTFADCETAVTRLADIMTARSYENLSPERALVP